MTIQPIYEEEWSDEVENYVPTGQALGYRAYSDDGEIFGWGDTPEDAKACLWRILWRL